MVMPIELLAGRTIVVTRAREQARALGSALEQVGARVVYCPAIRIADPVDPAPFLDAVRRLHDFEWVVLTSVNGVERFFAAVESAGIDRAALSALRFAAVGPATAAAIESHGCSVDVIPAAYLGSAIPEVLGPMLRAGTRVLLARAAGADPRLPEGLAAAGAEVVEVESYRSVPDLAGIGSVQAALDRDLVDLIAFTSPSAATYFTQAVHRPLSMVPIAAIGPITAARVRDLGLRVDIEAAEHTIPGLVAAIVSFFGGT